MVIIHDGEGAVVVASVSEAKIYFDTVDEAAIAATLPIIAEGASAEASRTIEVVASKWSGECLPYSNPSCPYSDRTSVPVR